MIELSFAAESLKATVSVLRGQRKRIRTRWKAYAARHGLHYRAHSSSIEGTVDGINVQVSMVRSVHRGERGWTVGWATCIEATAPGTPAGLLSVRTSSTETIRSMVGINDLQLDVPELDNRYRITTRSPSLARLILAHEAIQAGLHAPEGLWIEDGTVVHKRPGAALDDLSERIQEAVQLALPIHTLLETLPQRIAEQTGLTRTPFPARNRLRFAGKIQGIAVEMVMAARGDGMRILATEAPTVRSGLMTLIEDRTEPGVYDDHDYLPVHSMDPKTLGRAVTQAVARARTRQAATRQTWSPLTNATGLDPQPDPDFVLPRFAGTVDGVAVSVAPHASARKVFSIDARLPVPLRIALVVRPQTSDTPPAHPLGDVILDANVLVETDHHATACALLTRDGMHGHLLAVLKGYPGATVDQDRVRISECPPDPHALTAAVRDAVALARALSVPEGHP